MSKISKGEELEKLVGVVITAIIFVVFFAVLDAWDIDVSVRMIFSAMFAAIFAFIIFKTGKKKTSE